MKRVESSYPDLKLLAPCGTAVGASRNTVKCFADAVVAEVSKTTGTDFKAHGLTGSFSIRRLYNEVWLNEANYLQLWEQRSKAAMAKAK